jgi:ATP-dependent helicase/DNAse subunit B
VPLRLIVGPANAGKVELLLGRYLDALDSGNGAEPVLIVPNRADANRVELELLARRSALLGGSIGTFDDVFARLANGSRDARRQLGRAERTLLVRRVVERADLHGFAASAARKGFVDALQQTLEELESGLLAPGEVEGELGVLYAAYVQELERLARWDRGVLRRHAVERLRTELDAWNGEPVFAYGFEDLTGAEWSLLEALAARCEVTVSLPYEPGRPAFAALRRTAEDLAGLASEPAEELPPRYAEVAPPALARLERSLFSDEAGPPAALEGEIRFFEGAGTRGTLELVGEELLALARHGMAPERIGLVVPSYDRIRGALETVLGTFGIPYAIDGELRLTQTPLAHALAGCCASPGETARGTISSSSFGRRSRGSSGGRSISSRAGCAGARCRRPSASSTRPSDCAAGLFPRLPTCALRSTRSWRCASSSVGWSATPTASSSRRQTSRAGSTSERKRR